jgi:polyhydroxyalkanoate synthesis regulator protein
VLGQIIFEQENKEGQNLLPIAFLRQLIRFYGDSMQMLVPRYLEMSLDSLTREQEKFRTQLTQAFGGTPFAPFEELARQNMKLFEQAFAMFKPVTRPDQAEKPAADASRAGSGDIDELRRQISEMQKRLDRLGEKDKG